LTTSSANFFRRPSRLSSALGRLLPLDVKVVPDGQFLQVAERFQCRGAVRRVRVGNVPKLAQLGQDAPRRLIAVIEVRDVRERLPRPHVLVLVPILSGKLRAHAGRSEKGLHLVLVVKAFPEALDHRLGDFVRKSKAHDGNYRADPT
jgi:hypothetical protein